MNFGSLLERCGKEKISTTSRALSFFNLILWLKLVVTFLLSYSLNSFILETSGTQLSLCEGWGSNVFLFLSMENEYFISI